MALLDEIEAAQKEFAAAIKDAEDRKKEVAKFDAEATKASKEFGTHVKGVISELAHAQAMLDNWNNGFDSWIDALKEANVEFGKHKKRSVDAEKFYKNLEDEKADRDKARKKLGPGAKPSKEDELADAVFKKAKAAYDDDPSRGIEGMLKSIGDVTKSQEAEYKELTGRFKEAMANYDKMSGLLADFKVMLSFNKAQFGDAPITKSAVGPEFEKYFNRFK